jgi:hypothetical protein
MSDLPRVLVVGASEDEALDLAYLSKGFLEVTVEADPVLGVNRLGLEDFDMVVVDPDTDDLPVIEVVLGWLQRNKIPHVILKHGDNGNAKTLSASGRFRLLRSLEKRNFVDSVLHSIGVPA